MILNRILNFFRRNDSGFTRLAKDAIATPEAYKITNGHWNALQIWKGPDHLATVNTDGYNKYTRLTHPYSKRLNRKEARLCRKMIDTLAFK